MRALLDTHAFLWFITADARLSAAAQRLIEDARYDLFLSVASIWEIAIKAGTGCPFLCRSAPSSLSRSLTTRSRFCRFAVKHALDVADLPLHHRGPFDRLLVAQALAEDVPVLSADMALDPYGIRRVW